MRRGRKILTLKEVMPHLRLISGMPSEDVVRKLNEHDIKFGVFGPNNSGYYFRDTFVHVHRDNRHLRDILPIAYTRSSVYGDFRYSIFATYEILPPLSEEDLRRPYRSVRFDKEGNVLERTFVIGMAYPVLK